MVNSPQAEPGDLVGTADERKAQLDRLEPQSLTADWLRRQLDSALDAMAADETEIDIEKEGHADF